MLYADTHMHTRTHTQQWDEPNLSSETILSQFCKLQDSSTVPCLYPCKTVEPCHTLWINMESIFQNAGKVQYIHI